MKSIRGRNEGSIVPIATFIILLAIVGVLALVFGEILEPFFRFMMAGHVRSFLLMLFPYGLMFFILIVAGFSLMMAMQKKQYQEE